MMDEVSLWHLRLRHEISIDEIEEELSRVRLLRHRVPDFFEVIHLSTTDPSIITHRHP